MASELKAVVDSGIIEHWKDVIVIIGPLITAIVGLVIYCWGKLDKGQEKISKELELHIGQDVKTHNLLFDTLRKLSEEVNLIKGEDNAAVHTNIWKHIGDLEKQLNTLQGEHNNQHNRDIANASKH
jgi:hypothetical protein